MRQEMNKQKRSQRLRSGFSTLVICAGSIILYIGSTSGLLLLSIRWVTKEVYAGVVTRLYIIRKEHRDKKQSEVNR